MPFVLFFFHHTVQSERVKPVNDAKIETSRRTFILIIAFSSDEVLQWFYRSFIYLRDMTGKAFQRGENSRCDQQPTSIFFNAK